MELLPIVIILGCLFSPVLLLIIAAIGFYFFKFYRSAEAEKKRLSTRIETLSTTAQNATRELWLKEIPGYQYNSELEVETKFVYPMVRHLGYTSNEFKMRVSVSVRVGRQDVNGIADSVLYRDKTPVLVIEAKEAKQDLNREVQDQARSYCFALNVPAYMLVNGREIKLYKRGVDSDLLIFQATASELAERWSKLKELIGSNEAVG